MRMITEFEINDDDDAAADSLPLWTLKLIPSEF